MSVPQTRRRSSLSVTETQGIAYELILDYILTYPGSYPLRRPPMPLRSNSTRSRPQHPKQWSSSSRPLTPTLPRGSPALGTTSETPSPDVAAAAIFTATLLNQIGNSPSQPCSLPPIFTASFLRNCFPSELHLVDFPQALEGLEYLEHLNRRRRREVAGAKGRLGLRDGTTAEDAEGRKLCQGITAWLKDVENAERKAEALFTQLYVALRRWILINELSLTPFNKHNAFAMLNTLYPPSRCTSATTSSTVPQIPSGSTSTSQPSATLTPSVLSNQRTAFLNYITAVESRGPAVLKPLMNQGMRPGDSEWQTGWPAVAETVNVYLRICLKAVDDATAVRSREDIELPVSSSKGKRKADSGVSGRGVMEGKSPVGPYTPTPLAAGTGVDKVAASKQTANPTAAARTSAQSNASSASTPGDKNKPLPPSPPHGPSQPSDTTTNAIVATASATTPQSSTTPAPLKNFSRLEKIALEVRKIRAKREEQSQAQITPVHHIDFTSREHDEENTPSESARGLWPGQTSLGDKDMMMSGALPVNPNSSTNIGRAPTNEDDRGRTTSAMKRLRSLGDMKFGGNSNARSGKSRSRSRTGAASKRNGEEQHGRQDEVFDEHEMRRQRMIFEGKSGGGGS